MSDKYSGNFLERLIGVVERVMGGGGANEPTDASTGQPEAIARAYPTPTEQAEAWRRGHYDEEGEDEA